jgi:biopolymer transport protein ExbD
MNKKIYIISFISLIAILAPLIGLTVVREGVKNGPSVSLPGAVYAKSISSDTAPFRITVNKDGALYIIDERLSMAQLEETLSKLNPEDCWIQLRVDSECKFGKLEPVLSLLKDQRFGFTTFSVYEK